MSINDLLDELVTPFEARADGWDDVLGRARRARRRYVLLATAAFALVLVPTSVALRGAIADLFQGTPAPPAISNAFEASNKAADLATQEGFKSKFPRADVSQAHGVLEVQTSDGPEDLWAAPSDQGGDCWFIDFADDPAGPGGQPGFGGCDRESPKPSSHIALSTEWELPHPGLMTLSGQVFVSAVKVEAELKDGSRLTLPIVEGFFLASLQKGAQVSQLTAYDAAGAAVASWSRPS
jgi:hypothetical protein